jgi:hypothetical protein
LLVRHKAVEILLLLRLLLLRLLLLQRLPTRQSAASITAQWCWHHMLAYECLL